MEKAIGEMRLAAVREGFEPFANLEPSDAASENSGYLNTIIDGITAEIEKDIATAGLTCDHAFFAGEFPT